MNFRRQNTADKGQKAYCFAPHFFLRRGLRQHYWDEGVGDAVVMLHGNPSWSFYYRHLLAALKGDYRVIVPDHIGCGLSDKPDDAAYAYTLAQRIDDLEALLDSLAVNQRITLVVHDWGGMIGMGYAVRHPERIARLVVLNTAAFHLPAAVPFPLALRICRDTRLGTWLIRKLNIFARTAAYVGCKRNPMPSDLRKVYCSPYNSWKTRIATLRFVQDIPLYNDDPSYALVGDISAGLAQFQDRPMLIAWGEKDFVFNRPFLNEWLIRFPEATVHRYADCGHYILEDAAEDLIPKIVAFLAR
ncbi:MAG: alpha/beta fold hydrolase [Mariprofundaceae bacterium]|nr:alpha/beta fold hydrolase [Mariprofundaceae bacterium]